MGSMSVMASAAPPSVAAAHDECVERDDGKGAYLFGYLATIKTFTGPEGADQPFAEKRVHGDIVPSWI